jgi:hypothetical protein
MMSQRLMMPPPPPRKPRLPVESISIPSAENPEAETDMDAEPLQPDSISQESEEFCENRSNYDESGMLAVCDETSEVWILASPCGLNCSQLPRALKIYISLPNLPKLILSSMQAVITLDLDSFSSELQQVTSFFSSFDRIRVCSIVQAYNYHNNHNRPEFKISEDQLSNSKL